MGLRDLNSQTSEMLMNGYSSLVVSLCGCHKSHEARKVFLADNVYVTDINLIYD